MKYEGGQKSLNQIDPNSDNDNKMAVAQDEVSVTQETLSENTDDAEKVIDEIISEIPPKDKEKVKRIMMSSLRISGHVQQNSPLPPAFLEKIDKEHIDKFFDIQERSEERRYKDRQISRIYILIFVLIGTLVFIFLTLFLAKDNPELFNDILQVLFGFLGGLGVGKYWGGNKH